MNGERIVRYQSKCIKKTLNPDWNSFLFKVTGDTGNIIKIEDDSCFYIGSGKTKITIEIKDRDTLKDDDYIGQCVVPLENFIRGGMHYLMDKSNYRSLEEKSTLHIQIVHILNFQIKFSATNLPIMDPAILGFGGSSDPYFKILIEVGEKLEEIYRSKTIKRNLNPKWKSFFMNIQIWGDGEINQLSHS